MYLSAILAFYLTALGAAAPSPLHEGCNTDVSIDGRVTFTMTEPNCPMIKDYCTHCNGDFNCETDPRCEWCYEHGAFGNSI